MIAGIAGLGTLVAASGLVWTLAGILLLGFSMGWAGAVFARFMDHFDAGERGAGFGMVRTAYMLVAAPGSVAVGLLSDVFGWAAAMGFLIALLAFVLVQLTVNSAFDLGY